MMSASKHETLSRARGFTLIELIVVMLIMASLLSLVGPLAVKNVEVTRYKTEEMQFKNWLVKMSHTAFYSGKPISISLSGKLATATIGEQPSKDSDLRHTQSDIKTDQLELEQLFFQPQSFQLSKNGFPSVESITYQGRNRQFELDIVQHIYEKR